ncbi:hypothetical protein MLD38_035114 [Melastoma candidum]|uniref:Uncharacterized protein n=1 Tax=Melastoma candidum TaxID=119954 RepID=A0ACB9ME38_9MYRT|nr:hypothetical protein MLD38_035114 [Melastoma candidum]
MGTQTDEQVERSDAEGHCAPFDDVTPMGMMENTDYPGLPPEEGDEEVLMEAEDVIILGWKDGLGPDDLASGGIDEHSGADDASTPQDINQFDSSMRALIDKIMENFDSLDADEKVVQVQALKFIIEQVGDQSEETSRLLQFMAHLIQKALREQAKPLQDDEGISGSVAPPVPSRDAARDANLISLHEQILRLKQEVQMMESAPDNLRIDADVCAKKMEFFRLMKEWEVVMKEKKDSLLAEVAKWDDVMYCSAAPGSLREDGLPAYDGVPAAMGGIFVMKVPSGPDGQPIGAPRSPGPDSRLNNIITQIYEKMEDSRELGQPLMRSVRQQLRDIQMESNRAAKRNKCRVLRDFILQVDGAYDFFGGLLDQLLSRADEEARIAQEVNEDPLPFFSFGRVSGSQGTSFDDTSDGDGGSEVNLTDEDSTMFERQSWEDHGSSSE